jgi:hypothetical protein
VKLKYSKLETSNVGELAASGLDRLKIKIKTARGKLTEFPAQRRISQTGAWRAGARALQQSVEA